MNDDIRRVLIVDDETETRAILKDVLEPLNIEVVEAENGQVAFDLLTNQVFHLVLSDIRMPVMSGIDCFSKIQVAGVQAPFVFITGFGDSNHILQAVRLGAIDFIEKPFDIDELLGVASRALEVGVRRLQIIAEVEKSNPQIAKMNRMISLFRIENNKKRAS